MIELGTSAAYSAYAGSSSSVYSSEVLTPVEKRMEETSVEDSQVAFDDINDEAIISDEAIALAASEQGNMETETSESSEATVTSESEETKNEEELTSEQKEEVTKLKARDLEVKAHEQAHLSAAAGINASAPSYSYQTGPDGNRYAVGGEVSISFPQSDDPAENIANAETMKAAALAPANPSGQDLSVARHAEQIIAQAREEKSQQQAESSSESDSSETDTDETSGTVAEAPIGSQDSEPKALS